MAAGEGEGSGGDVGGGQRHTDGHCLVFSFSPPRAACASQSSDVLLCLEGMRSQRGHWFGSARGGGSELSNCVGDKREGGGEAGEAEEEKEGGWECRMPETCQRWSDQNLKTFTP